MNGRQKFTTPGRSFDHVYDPVYTTSSSGSYYKQHMKANTGGVQRVSKWNNYFSEVANKPSHSFQLKPSKHSVGPFPPRGQLRPSNPSDIVGKDLHKFVRRPVAPSLPGVRREALQAPSRDEQQQNKAPTPQKSRTIAVQTLYRESGAQTDAYTPNYKPIPPGAPRPEILEIEHMKFDNSTSISLEDVNTIKHLREKRAFEASLPPISDEASLELRRKLLEEQELKDWHRREHEMKQEQEARLQLLVEQLKDREEKQSAFLERRLDAVRADNAKKKKEALLKLQRKRVRMLRGLAHKRKFVDQPHKPDIVDEYADPASKVYAPAIREGKMPSGQIVDYGIPSTQNYHELKSLEQSMKPSVQNPPKPNAPKKIQPKQYRSRKAQQITSDINLVDNILRKGKENMSRNAPVVENIYKQFEPLVRPSTPTVEAVDSECVINRDAIFIQRLLRGRSVQNVMIEGKEKYLDLIHELQYRVEDTPESDAEARRRVLDTLLGDTLVQLLAAGAEAAK